MIFNQYKVKKGTLYLIPYIVLICCYFFLFVDAYFKNPPELNTLRIDADSYAYFTLNEAFDNIFLLLAINPNTLGPIILLRVTNHNIPIIFLVNLILFVCSYKVLVNNYKIDSRLFAILLVVNPLFIPAITTLNKEIFGVAAISFYLSYCKSKNRQLFFLSLAFAIITRWQMVFIIIFFEIFKWIVPRMGLSRGLALVLFILALSLTYPVFFSDIANLIDANTAERQQETAGNIIFLFNTLQDNFLYFIALVPKIFFNLYGNIFRFFQIFTAPESFDFNDVYNNVFLLGHQIVMLITSAIIVFQRKLGVENGLIYFCFIYLIVFSLGPMIQYRYIFPLYIVFALVISEPKLKKYS